MGQIWWWLQRPSSENGMGGSLYGLRRAAHESESLASIPGTSMLQMGLWGWGRGELVIVEGEADG